MTNICHVGSFFLCGLYCHLSFVCGRTGCRVKHFVLAECLKYVVLRVIFSSTQCKRRKGFSCSLLPEGVFLQTVHQILYVFSSRVLKCLETFLWCTFYHISSLLQAPKDWIKIVTTQVRRVWGGKKSLCLLLLFSCSAGASWWKADLQQLYPWQIKTQVSKPSK